VLQSNISQVEKIGIKNIGVSTVASFTHSSIQIGYRIIHIFTVGTGEVGSRARTAAAGGAAPAGRNDGDGGDAPEQIEGHRSRRPCGQEGKKGAGAREQVAGGAGLVVLAVASTLAGTGCEGNLAREKGKEKLAAQRHFARKGKEGVRPVARRKTRFEGLGQSP
jgi:hypothetical protein